MPCACFSVVEPTLDKLEALATLEQVRPHCPAIHDVLIPDRIWDEYRMFTRTSDEALHHPFVIGAIMSGDLRGITGLIHKYHLESERRFQPGVLGQLVERWWQAPTLVKTGKRRGRHERGVIFQSHVVELLVADALERAGRRIVDLDSWSGGVDAIALGDDGTPMRVEVKFLGVETHDFLAICDSIAGRPSGGAFSPIVARNYLTFRFYEAALQLQRHGGEGDGVVCAVVDEMDWYKFSTGRVIWPGFLQNLKIEEVADPLWLEFAERKSIVPDVVAEVIATADAIWLMKRVRGSTLVLEEERGRPVCPIRVSVEAAAD